MTPSNPTMVLAALAVALLGACEHERRPSAGGPPPGAVPLSAPSNTPRPSVVASAEETDARAAPEPTPTATGTSSSPRPVPPEPRCSGNTGPVRIPLCREPSPGESPAGYPAPYDRCPAALDGHEFSAELTDQDRRVNRNPQRCCYLDRCQISYGY